MRSSQRVLFIVPVGAAAKTINNILQEGEGTAAEPPKAAVEFVRECQLMSTFRHPNIVQFLGVAFFPGSRLPALVMERLLTSLHDLLAADAQSAPTPVIPSLSLSLSLSLSFSLTRHKADLLLPRLRPHSTTASLCIKKTHSPRVIIDVWGYDRYIIILTEKNWDE